MGSHSTPRGEESTYAGNKGKQTVPYTGRHRADDGKEKGFKLGTRDDKVANVLKMSDYDPTKRVSE